MHIRAILSLGLMGFGLSGFGGARPRAVDAPTSADVKSSVSESRAAESQAPEGITIPNFKPVEFPFGILIPDDGTSPSGWQEAKVNLEFTRYLLPITVIKWYCPFRIGMPIRNSTMGMISSLQAATMSAAVANVVAGPIDYKLPQGIFCQRFVAGMQAGFPAMYPDLGARVNR